MIQKINKCFCRKLCSLLIIYSLERKYVNLPIYLALKRVTYVSLPVFFSGWSWMKLRVSISDNSCTNAVTSLPSVDLALTVVSAHF